MSGARRADTSDQRAELAERVRARAAQELTAAQVAVAMGMTRTAVDRIAEEFSISFSVSHLRQRGTIQHRLDDDGAIEAAIGKLRPHHAPVCSMYTIRRSAMIPQPYHYGMTFRVGARRNVSISELFAMADALP